MSLDNQKNYLLVGVSVIVIVSMFCAITFSFIVLMANQSIRNNYSLAAHTIDGTKALAFADAGISKAAYEIKNNASPTSSINWKFPDITNTVSITINAATGISDTYNVTSRNTFKSSTKAISAQISKDATLGMVSLTQCQQIN